MIELLLESAAELVLLATWRALPLLAIALLVDLLLGRRLAARYHALLWTLVAVRLLLPVSIAAPLSVHGPIDRWMVGSSEPQSLTPVPDGSVLSVNAYNTLPANAWRSAEELQVAEHTAADHATLESRIILAVLLLWGLVAGVLLLRACVAHVRFALRLRHCRERSEQSVIDLILRECDDLRIRRRPRLKEVPGLCTPAVFGLMHATICLPPGLLERLDPKALRWVLRHELAHLRRRDTWALSLAAIMRAIHWPNPAVWLVDSKLRTRAEQAADEMALRGASTTDAVAYGRLLLEFAEAGPALRTVPALGLVPFIAGRGLRQRVDRLTRPLPHPGRLLRWLLGGALLLVTVAGLTDAQEPPAPQPEFRLSEIGAVVSPSEVAGPASIHSYDISALLDKLHELEPDIDVEQGLIHYVSHLAARRPQIVERMLIVEGTESQHQALAEMLEAMARSGPQQICTELRVLQVNLALAASIDWRSVQDAEQQAPGARPVLFAQVEEAQLARLIRAAQSDRRCNMLQAPKVTTFNGQTASIMDVALHPFVTGVVPVDGAWQPAIKVIDNGWKISTRSVVTETGTIELSLHLEESELGETRLANLPIRIADGPLADEPLVTVQVPTVRSSTLRMNAELAEGECLLIAVPRLFDPHGGVEAAKASATSLLYAVTLRKVANTNRLE